MLPKIFITGGTGYIGKRLTAILLKDGYTVRTVVRKGSQKKVVPGCYYSVANPLAPETFQSDVPENAIFIQLLGVSHPGPRKKELFYSIDLKSVEASVQAATTARVSHFIYVSVAQTPTSVMKDYQHCRAEGERLINESGLKSTIIRPWYVTGPGHYWPLVLQPLFKILELIPSTSAKAKALRLVSLKQMLLALEAAVKNPPTERLRIIEIEDIRKYNA